MTNSKQWIILLIQSSSDVQKFHPADKNYAEVYYVNHANKNILITSNTGWAAVNSFNSDILNGRELLVDMARKLAICNINR